MISGIGGYGGSPYLYSAKDMTAKVQEDTKVQDTAAVKVDGVKAVDAAAKTENDGTVKSVAAAQIKSDDTNAAQAQKAPAKSADVKGVMDAFRGGKDLSIFGSNSRFNEIQDAESAVQSKQKDDILDRYTYFVNPTTTGLGTDADGTVRLKQ